MPAPPVMSQRSASGEENMDGELAPLPTAVVADVEMEELHRRRTPQELFKVGFFSTGVLQGWGFVPQGLFKVWGLFHRVSLRLGICSTRALQAWGFVSQKLFKVGGLFYGSPSRWGAEGVVPLGLFQVGGLFHRGSLQSRSVR